jgi:hypothetical protein
LAVNRVLGSFIAPLAIAAIGAVAPASALGSAPIWYHGGVPVPASEPVPVTGSATLTLERAGTYHMKCTTNVPSTSTVQGSDSAFTPFTFTSCGEPGPSHPCPLASAVEVIGTAVSGAWQGVLKEGTPIRDKLAGVELEVHCAGTELGENFTGFLLPVATSGGELWFDSSSGVLISPEGGHLTLRGTLKLKATSGSTLVGAKPPPSEPARLRLTVAGEPVPVGTPVENQFGVAPGACNGEGATGTLRGNERPTDKVLIASSGANECHTAGVTMTGGIKEVKLKASGWGVWIASPTIVISEPGPCVYEYVKFEGVFGLLRPTQTYDGGGTGVLNAAASSAGCAASKVRWFSGTVFDTVAATLFFTERLGPAESNPRVPPAAWELAKNG